ncbi:GrpB family protein [Acidaminobacter sp. JC074]|uniref:GrpB family protein n=1 Tax=Acidaminobacter sp. JC074 TaxID=2530199 RepID=UPI001F0EA8D2|nr:GrpB family protein [Acidaminobacter sp. JC074]MCH4887590.1 GrpB family protein [Acidaminobacter sp. JC074]
MRKIVVENYNPKWAHAFNELKAAYETHIDMELRIEHVGSTSVPGLAAKPIIDIDIVVTTKEEVLKLIDALEELGYIHQGELGIPGRHAFKRSIEDVPLMYEHHSKWPAHHLYVVYEDSLAFKNHMTLKDYLMAHEDAVKEYSELKLALAHKYPHDIDMYVKEKTPFITRVLSACEFTPEEVDEITKMNE